MVASTAQAQDPAVPPATSPQTQRWDYLCLTLNSDEKITDEAKKAGHEGWEMVTVYEPPEGIAVWCFKRAL